MSSSENTPPAKLTAYERWELPLVNAEHSGSRGKPAKDIYPPSARDIEAIFQQARDNGYQEGYQEGMQAGEKQGYEEKKQAIIDTIEMLSQVMQQLSRPIAEIDQVIMQQIYGMVSIICERVIHRSIEHEREIIMNVINTAMSELPVNEMNIRIRVNPVDAEFIARNLQSLAMSASGDINHNIIGDASISRGGCVVETGSSEVDARLETRIGKMFDELHGE